LVRAGRISTDGERRIITSGRSFFGPRDGLRDQGGVLALAHKIDSRSERRLSFFLSKTRRRTFEDKPLVIGWGVGDLGLYDPGIEGFGNNVALGEDCLPGTRRERVLREESVTLT